MSKPKSIREMMAEGSMKRANFHTIRLEEIHEEPGFNLRIEGPELETSIQDLEDFILSGGKVPPLEVRLRTEGGVWIVDGHRRARALKRAKDKGAPIEWVDVSLFTGNDLDRTTRIMTSAEGRSLSPLETALGYKRLAAFGQTPDQIAKLVGKTRQHVDQLLILANAPAKVHQLVREGTVSAAVAVDVTRKHGDDAAQVLGEEVGKAKAAGKGKITAGTIKGKPLPPKVVVPLVDSVDGFMEVLDAKAHEVLAAVKSGSASKDATVPVSAAALAHLLACHQDVIDARAEQKRKAKAKAAKMKQQALEEK